MPFVETMLNWFGFCRKKEKDGKEGERKDIKTNSATSFADDGTCI